jgi:hypothetical protein
VKIRDAATGAVRATPGAAGARVHALACAPGGRTLVTMGRTGGLKLWWVGE